MKYFHRFSLTFLLAAISTAQFAEPLASLEVMSTRHSKFIIKKDRIENLENKQLSVRLSERLTQSSLKKRFSGYRVNVSRGEDCVNCATIHGSGGSFTVFLDDKWKVLSLETRDKMVEDLLGNKIGMPLIKAVGNKPTKCDDGDEETCASPDVPGLSYIVEGSSGCQRRELPSSELFIIPKCKIISGIAIYSASR